MTKVFRSTLAVATVLAVAGVHKANATPVYAFASLGLTNLTINGISLTGASVTTTTSANYPGSARQRFVSRGDGSDAQAVGSLSSGASATFASEGKLITGGTQPRPPAPAQQYS